MVSKARLKYIKSLQIKKYRKQEQRFVVEGATSVMELLRSDFRTELLLATETFLQRVAPLVDRHACECITVTPDDLKAMGSLKTNESALAVAVMPPNEPFSTEGTGWTLALDGIRDPGNLGTIIRIADWYGLRGIVASPDCTDLYNSKVIQASMGSFTRIKVWYTDLPSFLEQQRVEVLGAFLQGSDIHTYKPPSSGILVIGNEASGISDAVARKVTERITIPRYGKAESLNAAIATAVICDNLIGRSPRH
jgi:TrmH family RNA methyltransferase